MRLASACLIAALVLAGCQTTGKYLDDRRAWTDPETGILYECREPKPWPGGNCKTPAEWKVIDHARS